MPKRLAAAVLLAICGTCQGVEPPIPLPPETSAIPATTGEARPALPTFDRGPASSAARPALPAAEPDVVNDVARTPWIVPSNWGTRYVPEAVIPDVNAGLHPRYPYYSYRRPWYPAGPQSVNVTIVW